MHEGKPVLAVFAFLYAAADMRTGLMPRPQLWLIADMESGAVLERYKSDESDFSAEPADGRYTIHWEPPISLSAGYFDDTYAVLDEVRRQYLASGTVDGAAYRRYFDAIVAAVPPAYRVFYEDLGSPDAL